MTTTQPQTQPTDGGGSLLIVALLIGGLFVLSQKPNDKPAPQHAPPVVIGSDARVKVAAVLAIASRNPTAARRLGAMLGAAADMIRNDTGGAAITTTEQVFRFVERAERLYVTGTDGQNALPGIAATVSEVLKSPDVFGPSNGPLTPAKRAAGCDALRVIADELKGAK